MAKDSKKGKNLAKCSHYRFIEKKTVNKRRKLTKHLVKNPDDSDAKKALKNL